MTKSIIRYLAGFLLLTTIILFFGCVPKSAISITLPTEPTATITPTTQILLSTVTPIADGSTAVSTFLPITPAPYHYSVPTQQANAECLSPITNFAFPVQVITDLGNITPHPSTLPPEYWQEQLTLPEDFLFTRSITISSNGDIWIQGEYPWDHVYYVYRPDGDSGIYREETTEHTYSVPQRLLQLKDGALWGIGTSFSHGTSYSLATSTPLMSKFDESIGQFTYIENTLYNDKYLHVLDLKQDDSGMIWLLLHYSDNGDGVNRIPSGLYRFDPNTLRMDLFLLEPNNIGFNRLQPVQDGSIWLLGHDWQNDETVLMRYFPSTGELQPYQGTFSYSQGEDFSYLNIHSRSPLFLDNANRLWISTEGWLSNPASEYPSWYRIIQPPIFIDEYVDGSGNIYRDIPYGMNESSDGMFWFWGLIGIVRLNPEIGEWCLFTTYHSPVVEDEHHNLWMVADNKLFKYERGE